MNDKLKNQITDMLLAFKIQPEVQGFEFLRCGIGLCYENNEMKNNITKLLYPSVAQIYHTTAETVERGIRTAIDNAFLSGGLLEINEMCQMIVYNNDFKWTNSELISTLVELIKLKELRKDLKAMLAEK